MHGEKKDTDTNAAEDGKNNMLPQFLLDYEPQDIYNADETGLYHKAISDGTLTFKKETISGSKKSKNLDLKHSRSDKRRLLLIGKSKYPRWKKEPACEVQIKQELMDDIGNL